MTDKQNVKILNKIILFATERAKDCLQNNLSEEELNEKFLRFKMVQFERLRQFNEKFQLGTLEELEDQFLKEYQDNFNLIYSTLKDTYKIK